MILMACASIGVSGRFADKKNRAREREEYSEEESSGESFSLFFVFFSCFRSLFLEREKFSFHRKRGG